MKLRCTSLSCLIALLAACPTSAAIIQGSDQGCSSLFLSVWDSVRNVSYTRNLGTNLNGFLPSSVTTLPNDGNIVGTSVTGNRTPEAGLTVSFSGDSLFTSNFSASDPDNVRWNIAAFDTALSTSFGSIRAISTASAEPTMNRAGVQNLTAGGNNYLLALVNDTAIGNPGVNSVVTTDPILLSFAGNLNWGDVLNTQGISSSATGFSSSLGFFYLARTATGAGSTVVPALQYGNSTAVAAWRLAVDGTATYSLSAAGVAPVPLPPAIGLFAAGLLAFLGVLRRRSPARDCTLSSANEPETPFRRMAV